MIKLDTEPLFKVGSVKYFEDNKEIKIFNFLI